MSIGSVTLKNGMLDQATSKPCDLTVTTLHDDQRKYFRVLEALDDNGKMIPFIMRNKDNNMVIYCLQPCHPTTIENPAHFKRLVKDKLIVWVNDKTGLENFGITKASEASSVCKYVFKPNIGKRCFFNFSSINIVTNKSEIASINEALDKFSLVFNRSEASKKAEGERKASAEVLKGKENVSTAA
ncbi:MAG: hypothetical protein H0X51_01340 [Parachlamydiaceae bacterium]|nr:hypothetical protein [Parachlamydiaceae bacterium]